MKKYSSVFAMIARTTLYKNLIVMFLMAAAQMMLFVLKLQNYERIGKWTLSGTVKDSFMIIPLAIGFFLVSLFLVKMGGFRGSNQGYLLNRLQITETEVFGLQALYNCICFVILWAVEVVVLMGASSIYVEKATDVTSHTKVMAFYSNGLMHSLLPMKDTMGWLYLLALILGVGLFLALFSALQRKGTSKGLIGCGILLGIMAANFPREVASRKDPMFIFAAIALCPLLIREITGLKIKGDEEVE